MTFDFKIQITNQELQAACALSLKEMFADNFFSASKLWDCCDILGIGYMQEMEIAKYINIHHCTNFDKMQPEQIQRLKQVCFAMIGVKVRDKKRGYAMDMAFNLQFADELAQPEPNDKLIEAYHKMIESADQDLELVPCQY